MWTERRWTPISTRTYGTCQTCMMEVIPIWEIQGLIRECQRRVR